MALLVVLIHVGYLTSIFLLQPTGRFGPPPIFPRLGTCYYEDQDVVCMALRGLNASAGRTAGRPDDPKGLSPEEFARSLQSDQPLQPHYYLEYPHANLVVFCLPYWLFGSIANAPAGLLDAPLGNVVEHEPRNDEERALWRQLCRAVRVNRVVIVLCLAGLVFVLWLGYLPDGDLASSCGLLLLPGALFYVGNYFDIIPAFLTALSLALLGRKRIVLSAVCLASGAMIKVFPGLIVPLVVRYLLSQPGGRRATAVWIAGFAGTVLALVLPPLVREGFDAVAAPYRWQLSRTPFMWTAYEYVLPAALAENTLLARAFRFGALLATLVALVGWRIPDLASLLRRGGVLVIVFVLLQIVFSPQWMIWFWPFLLPLTSRYRFLTGLVVVLDLATVVLWPNVPPWEFGQDLLQYTRLAAMIGMIVVLLAARHSHGCGGRPPGGS